MCGGGALTCWSARANVLARTPASCWPTKTTRETLWQRLSAALRCCWAASQWINPVRVKSNQITRLAQKNPNFSKSAPAHHRQWAAIRRLQFPALAGAKLGRARPMKARYFQPPNTLCSFSLGAKCAPQLETNSAQSRDLATLVACPSVAMSKHLAVSCDICRLARRTVLQ